MKPYKTTLLAGLLAMTVLAVSCSKNENPAKADEAPKPAAPAAADGAPETGNYLKAARNGQQVMLEWRCDLKKIRSIDIYRNNTGRPPGYKIAILGAASAAGTWDDTLENGGAYWYWIVCKTRDGKEHTIAPVRVAPDRNMTGSYGSQTAQYKVKVTRTDEIANLVWDFPDDKYHSILVYRYTTAVNAPRRKGQFQVCEAREWKSHYTDALPDANADYWYWFQIRLDSGKVLHRGPIKAEYANP